MGETKQKRAEKLVTLEEFIIQSQEKFPQATGELSQLLMDITLASKFIAREINRSIIKDIHHFDLLREPAEARMQRLEDFAKTQLYYALKRSKQACMMISDETENEPELLNTHQGKYIVVIDPLDGTPNIEINASVATTFSIFRRISPSESIPDPEEALQEGFRQVVGGYVLYGSSIMLVFTAEGMGVNFFTMDPSLGEFFLSIRDVKVPDFKACFSINSGLYALWSREMQRYYDFILSEDRGSRGPFTLRYGGSMVGDVHRILMEGGIFAYPDNQMFPEGKLHLMYKCNPLAFIMEQAGGKAIDGKNRILDIKPTHIHQKTPVFMGSKENIAQVGKFF